MDQGKRDGTKGRPFAVEGGKKKVSKNRTKEKKKKR